MAAPGIERRLTALELDVAGLRKRLAKAAPAQGDWLDEIYGAFENDTIYEEAIILSREYRESLRPKPRSTRSKSVRFCRSDETVTFKVSEMED